MPTQDPIIQAVLAFLNAETWADSKQIVQTNPDLLLTRQAEQLLINWLAQSSGNKQATHRITERRALLARCRAEGIEAVFAELVPSPSSPITEGSAYTVEVFETSAVFLKDLRTLAGEIDTLTHPHDMPRRIELCQAALSLVDKNSQPQLWATLQSELARSFVENPWGNIAENHEQAIAH